MRRVSSILICFSFLAGSAGADEPGVIDDVLAILHERGLVDEARYSELVSRNGSYEQENEDLLGRIEFSGDLRTRLENFWFDDSALDEGRPDRTRARYRLRLQGVARINERTEAVFRVASSYWRPRPSGVMSGSQSR